MAERTFIYAGRYSETDGIHIYALDGANGHLTSVGAVGAVPNPSYLAIDRAGRCLYAVSEFAAGVLAAYAINPDNGALTLINTRPTQGGDPAYVSLTPDGRYALASNYSSGAAVIVFPIRADGGLDPASSSVYHDGSGPLIERQEKPHPHAALTDPAGRFVYVPDLGTDSVMIYRLEDGQLIPNNPASLTLPPGAGPRHLTFHPNGLFAYVIAELNNTVTALAFDASTGALDTLQTIPALPENFSGESYCADIHLSPDGRFLYGSNRGHDSIVIYEVDRHGKLVLVAHQPTGGNWPRNFVIDPSGEFLLVVNQNSDSINCFRRDADTGLLEATWEKSGLVAPACLKVLPQP